MEMEILFADEKAQAKSTHQSKKIAMDSGISFKKFK